MTIEYFYVQEAMDSIDVDDIGNVNIQVNNDSGCSWLLSIATELGWTCIKQFGPVNLDDLKLGYSFYYSYYKIEYKESKLIKIIKDFVNSSTKNVTQAFIIDETDFNDIFNKIKEVM